VAGWHIQVPVSQVGVNIPHLPHFPQFSTLKGFVAPCPTSQPSERLLLQSNVFGVHCWTTHFWSLHLTVSTLGFPDVVHLVPQDPQLSGSVARAFSQPVLKFPSQSALRGKQVPTPQVPSALHLNVWTLSAAHGTQSFFPHPYAGSSLLTQILVPGLVPSHDFEPAGQPAVYESVPTTNVHAPAGK